MHQPSSPRSRRHAIASVSVSRSGRQVASSSCSERLAEKKQGRVLYSKRHLGIAADSGGELETQILLAERFAPFPPERARDLLERHRKVERMLAGLTRSLDER